MDAPRSNDERLGRIADAGDAAQTARRDARERFAHVIREGHREGLTYAAIARHLGISRERVRQIAMEGQDS
ncbi:Sigma-70%2C region 4 [Mycobacteroides abscessus]|uniref:sigma factor-like helix-turn-helix DNA-binding protein n=1 Tax=Mycobacteroides abscessus TaxID=36809 RepID=UPI0005DF74B4|nr:sigma factor-like helix-turn-helix DNA-binding protein [Mycobacteroides abscessus]CPX20559.1 Sigma-70%2C region 4 [Mycobacteroides abscessus]CRG61212.1 Sigma-70%2C region 4 [Mycobacteroides abscessus]